MMILIAGSSAILEQRVYGWRRRFGGSVSLRRLHRRRSRRDSRRLRRRRREESLLVFVNWRSEGGGCLSFGRRRRLEGRGFFFAHSQTSD